jgi:hypothetical protein
MLHGLIYQARLGQFTHGFDESNPYNRIYITKVVYFHNSPEISSKALLTRNTQPTTISAGF